MADKNDSKDGDKKDDDKNSLPQEVTEILKSVGDGQKAMLEGFQKMQESMQSGFTGLVDNLKPKDDSDAGSNKATFEDADLEGLSRKEFMGVMTDSLMGRIKEELFNPLADELKRTRTVNATDRMRQEIKDLRALPENKDFDHWKDELKVKVTDNPKLSMSEALHLVRQANPEKAAQLRTELKMDEAGHEGTDSQDGREKFGGFRSDGGTESERPDYENSTEAAKAAWDEAMAEIETSGLLGEGAQ